MSTLIERLSTSEKPTRELADEVLEKYGWSHEAVGYGHELWRHPDGRTCFSVGKGEAPNPLTDLNDAVALVPEGWKWAMGIQRWYDREDAEPLGRLVGTAEIMPDKKGSSVYDLHEILEAEAATPAIALTIACLKAKEMNDDG